MGTRRRGRGQKATSLIVVGSRVRVVLQRFCEFGDAAARRPSTLSDPRPSRTVSTTLGSFPARWSIFLRMSSASFRFPAFLEADQLSSHAACREFCLPHSNAAPTSATRRFSRCL